MIPQAVTSFFDNTKEKISNPFFGTLILVWIVRNWELVFTLFNFDEGCTVDDKKAYINNYYNKKLFWDEFLSNVFIALGLMIIGYFLILITRVIMNFGENRIMPYIIKITNSKKIITRDRYEEVSRERDLYFNTLESERNNTVKLEQSHSHLKNEVARLSTTLETVTSEKDNFENSNKELEKKVARFVSNLQRAQGHNIDLENKIGAFEEMIIASNKLHYNNNIHYEVTQKYFLLKQQDSMVTFFKTVANNIVQNSSYSGYSPDVINKFVDLKLIFIKDIDAENLYSTSNLQLTKLGEEVFENSDIIDKALKDEELHF